MVIEQQIQTEKLYTHVNGNTYIEKKQKRESRAIAGRTVRCRCKCRYASAFTAFSHGVHFESDKTAELSQRRPRDAPNIWVPWKVLRVLTTHPTTFPQICNGLLFRSILRMCVQNLKFVALPIPGIIRGTQKNWAVPGYAHAQFSPQILKGFCSDGTCEYTCQIWSS